MKEPRIARTEKTRSLVRIAGRSLYEGTDRSMEMRNLIAKERTAFCAEVIALYISTRQTRRL